MSREAGYNYTSHHCLETRPLTIILQVITYLVTPRKCSPVLSLRQIASLSSEIQNYTVQCLLF